jgi:hypothetical protein
MVNYKLELLGINPMRPWRDALEAYVTTELGLAQAATASGESTA